LWKHREICDQVSDHGFRFFDEILFADMDRDNPRLRPWLLVGLLGALLAADIVGAYEQQLQANVMLAFFIPGIVYLADAVGTQTEALVIRGLSVGVSIGGVVRREVYTGLLVGVTLA
jgi:Mg/Co/Ni transporter MgtE